MAIKKFYLLNNKTLFSDIENNNYYFACVLLSIGINLLLNIYSMKPNNEQFCSCFLILIYQKFHFQTLKLFMYLEALFWCLLFACCFGAQPSWIIDSTKFVTILWTSLASYVMTPFSLELSWEGRCQLNILLIFF